MSNVNVPSFVPVTSAPPYIRRSHGRVDGNSVRTSRACSPLGQEIRILSGGSLLTLAGRGSTILRCRERRFASIATKSHPLSNRALLSDNQSIPPRQLAPGLADNEPPGQALAEYR